MLKWCPVANARNTHTFDMAIGHVSITSKFHLDNKHSRNSISLKLFVRREIFFIYSQFETCKLSCYWNWLWVPVEASAVHKYKKNAAKKNVHEKNLGRKVIQRKIVIEMACGLLWLNYETNNRYKMSTGSYQRSLQCNAMHKKKHVHMSSVLNRWFSGEIQRFASMTEIRYQSWHLE